MQDSGILIKDAAIYSEVIGLLRSEGHDCTAQGNADALLRGLRRGTYRLVLIDVRDCPDWQSVLDQRNNWLTPGVVVILLGDPGRQAIDLALAHGADDFIARPSVGIELIARVRAALRRLPRSSPGSVGRDDTHCRLDREGCAVVAGKVSVELTAREMGIAHMLFERLGELVPRNRIAREVWGCDESAIGRSLDQHIYQLRRKLKRCAGESLVLRGVYGSGWRLDAPVITAVPTGSFFQTRDQLAEAFP